MDAPLSRAYRTPLFYVLTQIVGVTALVAWLAYVARHTGISKQHLIHLFKRETALPPIEYFLRMKMQRAAQLLDLTDLSVKEIGHAVGMTDPYYFSRLFKQMMGHSPSRYREIPNG